MTHLLFQVAAEYLAGKAPPLSSLNLLNCDNEYRISKGTEWKAIPAP